MGATSVLQREAMEVYDYRCSAGPGDRPFAELHDRFSVAYVRKGTFGYETRGRVFELVAGSLLIGRPGDEYICTHDHHVCGDECLSIQLTPDVAETTGVQAAFVAFRRSAADSRAGGAGRAGAGRGRWQKRCRAR